MDSTAWLVVAGIVIPTAGGIIFQIVKEQLQKRELRQQEQERVRQEQERVRQEQERQNERDRQLADFHAELARLCAAILTSTNQKIIGRKIVRQIRMISVDSHDNIESAEADFLSKVEEAGGNAVINMSVQRRHGGFVSVQGDAVFRE